MKDYYYILGISRTASTEQIKSAYRKLSIKFHPDKNDGDKFFEERFKEIQEAYDTLSNLDRKKNYDFNLNSNSKSHDRQYTDKSYEEKLKKDFEEELKKRKVEYEDQLKRREREHLEQLRKTEEEVKRRYQTPEQRAAEETEIKRKREEFERTQEHNRAVRELEELKTKLKEKSFVLESLNKAVLDKQNEISQTKNEIEKLERKLGNGAKKERKKAMSIIFLFLLIIVGLVFSYFYFSKNNSANNPYSNEQTKRHLDSIISSIDMRITQNPNKATMSSSSKEKTEKGNIEKGRKMQKAGSIKDSTQIHPSLREDSTQFHPPLAWPPAIFSNVEQMPVSGYDINDYLNKNIHYPEAARENNIEGRVIMKFVVNEDGSISDVQVMRGIDPSCDGEAKRVVTAMPKWKPGKQNGKAVKVYFTLPIVFKLQ